MSSLECLADGDCGSIPPLLSGAFDLTLQREGEAARNIGNVVIGTLQDSLETFFGAPADGSQAWGQNAYSIRESINLIVSADEITCENLRLWLETPVVNVAGGQELLFEHILERSAFRAVATKELCDGTEIEIVLHRVFLMTPLDLLFQSGAITGNQFTLRAMRDPDYPTNPFGKIFIANGDCASS